MNGCTYRFQNVESGNILEEAKGRFSAKASLVCPLGAEVVVQLGGSANCTISVAPYTEHSGVSLRNLETEPKVVESAIRVSQSAIGSGGICGHNAELNWGDTFNLKAFMGATQVDLEGVLIL
jgi:hypothetical protein